MPDIWFYTLILVVATPVIFILFSFKSSTNKAKNLPPSSPSLPFIGHLHLVKNPLHRTLYDLSKKLGPVYSLRFGSLPVVVVSSSSAAEECLSKNDIIFANRPRLFSSRHISYNFSTMGTAAYGERWRNLRKISSIELLSPSRIKMFAGIRRDEIKKMLSRIKNSSNDAGVSKVELQSMLSDLTFKVLMRMIAGKKYYGDTKFTAVIKKLLEVTNSSHPGEFVAPLRWIDCGGYVRRVKNIAKETDGFLQSLLDEHRKQAGMLSSSANAEETVIDRLLHMQLSQPQSYPDITIKSLALDLIVAGTDTSAVTIEWAMSYLLNNPKILEKAKSEIDTQVGQDNLINETELLGLKYLHNVVSETHRISPAAPLLLPHMSSEESQISGFDIPSGNMLLINAWAIHHDPKIWSNPMEFEPERFEGLDVNPYNFMPFGVGRRSCPGSNLGNRMVSLALASLIQCFEWSRISVEEVDLTEGKGLTMPKAQPLEALCKPRPITNKIL